MPEEEEEVQDQENQESVDEKKGKGKLLKFILIPVIVAIQAVVAYFLVFNYLVEDPEEEVTKKEETKMVGLFYELKDLVVNPAETLGRRFLVLEMALETHMETVIVEAEGKEIWIKDAVISLLVKKTSEQLLDIENRASLKREILTALNSQMSEGKFENIYFTKFLMQ